MDDIFASRERQEILEDFGMSKQKIAVTWEMCGYIEIDADSVEMAMKMVKENPDDYSLPFDGGEYVDGSFQLSTNDVEKMKIICGIEEKEKSIWKSIRC